jgi:hypothetical protein
VRQATFAWVASVTTSRVASGATCVQRRGAHPSSVCHPVGKRSPQPSSVARSAAAPQGTPAALPSPILRRLSQHQPTLRSTAARRAVGRSGAAARAQGRRGSRGAQGSGGVVASTPARRLADGEG